MPNPQKYTATDGTVTWRARFRIGGGSRSETFATKKDADRFVSLLKAVGGARARAIMNETRAVSELEYVHMPHCCCAAPIDFRCRSFGTVARRLGD